MKPSETLQVEKLVFQSLNNLPDREYPIQKDQQVILLEGTNGSGKSLFLELFRVVASGTGTTGNRFFPSSGSDKGQGKLYFTDQHGNEYAAVLDVDKEEGEVHEKTKFTRKLVVKVKPKTGKPYVIKSKRAIIDLIGNNMPFSIDMIVANMASEKGRRANDEMLGRMIGVEEQIGPLNSSIDVAKASLEEKRSRKKVVDGMIANSPVNEGMRQNMPDPVDVDSLVNQSKEFENAKDAERTAASLLSSAEEAAENVARQINELKERLNKLEGVKENSIGTIKELRADHQKKKEAASLLDQDYATMIQEGTATNLAIQESGKIFPLYDEREVINMEMDSLGDDVIRLTNQRKGIVEQASKERMPLDLKIGISDETNKLELLIRNEAGDNFIPVHTANTARKIYAEVLLNTGRDVAFNVIPVKDASNLDFETTKALLKYAKESGHRVMLEKVDADPNAQKELHIEYGEEN